MVAETQHARGSIGWWARLLGSSEKLLLSVLAGVALLVSVAAVTTEWLGFSHRFREYVPAGILVLLATFVLFFLFGYDRRIEAMRATVVELRTIVEQSRAGIADHTRKWRQLGIQEIYRGRDDPGQKDAYVDLLRRAKSSLLIIGVTLKDLTRDERPALLAKCTRGCPVRLLMLTPERWPNTRPVLDPVEPADLKDHFTHSLRNIRVLANQVAKRNRDGKFGKAPRSVPCLEVRFYDQAPSVSLAVADASSESGRMRVEFTPHNETNRESYFRPMMDLVPAGEAGLFRQFCLHYEGLWETSKPYLRVTGSRISRNRQLDIDVAEVMLGLELDWVPREYAGDDLVV